MSQAQDVRTLHPAAGATDAVIDFVSTISHAALPDEVRHYARRHLLDTVGVMISGASGNVATQAETVIAAARPAGTVPVAGRTRRADILDAAFLGGTAAHGIELDDGYTKGSVHPGCTVVPSLLAAGYVAKANGEQLLEALVSGYETVTAIGRAVHPDLRHRGFHPTGAVSVFGAAMAVGKLRGLDRTRLSHALGIAASSSAGLFAFVNGGGDIKRLHAGHAAREGLQAALLAEAGLEGPPRVLEARDGFMQAFAFDRPDKARPVLLPPHADYGTTDCYIKPNPCCRHIQPAVEALIGILTDEGLSTDDVERVEVETYRIAAEHAATGWDDFASAQLSFRYLMSLALRHRQIRYAYFFDDVRNDPSWDALAAKFTIGAPPEIDRLYPKLRPARVTVHAKGRRFVKQADEAMGSRLVPLDDAGLEAKFHGLVEPVLGKARSQQAAARLWDIDNAGNVAAIVEDLVP